MLKLEAQQIDRMASVIGLIREVFSVAVVHLGEKYARDLWRRTAKGKPGRPKGKKEPELDELLRQIYDRLAPGKDAKGKKALPREVAALVKDKIPKDFPATVGAIQARLRRLLKARDREIAARAEVDRKLAAEMLAG